MSNEIRFFIDESETVKLNTWILDHNNECSIVNEGATGGKFTYHFTPTSLGTITKVSCACGKNIDLTDYKSW